METCDLFIYKYLAVGNWQKMLMQTEPYASRESLQQPVKNLKAKCRISVSLHFVYGLLPGLLSCFVFLNCFKVSVPSRSVLSR